MNDFFAGPLFFAISMTLISSGVVMLSVLFRQAWIIFAFGFIGIGLAIPGWLTAVGFATAAVCIVAFFRWRKLGVGRTL